MATNIIAFPGHYVTPDERAERRELEERRDSAWIKLGTPYEYAGTNFALFMAMSCEQFVPQTRDDMTHCLHLMIAESLAQKLGVAERAEARQMRHVLEARIA